MKKLFPFCLLLCLPLMLNAQKTLLLHKTGSSHRHVFHFGDQMTVRAANPPRMLSGTLNGMNDSVIVLNMLPVKISDITHVRVKSQLAQRLKRLVIFGGIFYFGISTVNKAIQHDRLFTSTDAIVYGSLLAGLGVSYAIRYRMIPLNGRWILLVADQMIYK